MKICKPMMDWVEANSEYDIMIHEAFNHPEIKSARSDLDIAFKKEKKTREKLKKMM